MGNVINICLSTDNNYIQHTATVVASILSNAKKKEQYRFYILSEPLEEKNKTYFLTLKKIHKCDIDFINIDKDLLNYFSNINLHKHLNLSIYNRLFIPYLLPNLDKVIYLDSDIVVIKNISKLNEIDIDKYLFLGVMDPFANIHSTKLGYSSYPYINSGVLVINCKGLKKINYLETIYASIDSIKDKSQAGDQDIINYCFHKNIGLLPSVWNAFLPFNYKRYGLPEPTDKDYIASKKHPYIIHFVGPNKPWQIQTKHPYKQAYLKYYRKTYWYKKERTNKMVDLIKKIPFRIHFITERNHKKCILYKGEQPLFCLFSRKIRQEYLADECQKNKEIDLLCKIKNELYLYNSISKIHSETFKKYKNINKGKEVVLLASGPSLDKFIPIKDAIYVGVNKAYTYDKCTLDYLFIQDYSGSKDYINELIEYKRNHDNLNVFMGINAFIPNDKWLIPESIALKCHAERYYTLFSPNEKIFGEDFTYDILSGPLKCFGSITFAALQFILWTNPKTIYLVGCDTSLSGYSNCISSGNNKLDIRQVIDGYKKFKKFAQKFYPETKIISINPVGLKTIFKDLFI